MRTALKENHNFNPTFMLTLNERDDGKKKQTMAY